MTLVQFLQSGAAVTVLIAIVKLARLFGDMRARITQLEATDTRHNGALTSAADDEKDLAERLATIEGRCASYHGDWSRKFRLAKSK